ncbi:MAG: hypothetical protein AB8E82_02995 [Aureispira sp.]
MKDLLKTTWILSLILLFCSALLVSCTQEKMVDDADVALYATLGVETNEVDHIAGKTVIDNHKIVYDVKDEKGEYFITFDIDGNSLNAQIDFDTEIILYTANNIVLTAEQKDAMYKFYDQFAEALVKSNGNQPDNFEVGRMEFIFLKTVEYLSYAPPGYVYTNRKVVSEVTTKAVGNDGISCIKRGTSYNLSYTLASGSVVNKRKTAGYNGGGTFGCMGRCGANCGGWLPSSWTLDCFEHDQCGLDTGASGGSSDSNCGDEFDQAADDWTWGVWNGCRG